MSKIAYIDRTFRGATLDIITHANTIITDYTAQGLKLTLRQLYYRFVAADMLPNTTQSYNRLGSIINDGRLAGLIDWESIEDRTRNVEAILEHFSLTRNRHQPALTTRTWASG